VSEPTRLVVRLPNWLGDVVMAFPALAAIRHAYPGAHLALAGLPGVTPIFEETTAVRPQQLLAVQKADEAQTLRTGAFDTAILLTN
jgi:heptosyltransferase-2